MLATVRVKKTFDIVGLSEEEFAVITAALGRIEYHPESCGVFERLLDVAENAGIKGVVAQRYTALNFSSKGGVL